MSEEQIQYYRKASEDGSLPDDKNPLLVLGTFHTDLLVKIINHDIDMVEFAGHELAERGLNREGKWVGFEEAIKIQQPKKTPIGRKRARGKGL